MADSFDMYYEIFYYFYLNRLVGNDLDFLSVIPLEDGDEKAVCLLARNIAILANLAADACLGKAVDDMSGTLRNMLGYYDFCERNQLRSGTAWYKIDAFRVRYCRMALNVARAVSTENLESIFEILVETMHEGDWSPAVQRDVWQVMLDFGYDREKYIAALSLTDRTVMSGVDLTQRRDFAKVQADAWLKVDDREKCMSWLKECVRQTFGVGYKDYQPLTFVRWIRTVNGQSPENALDRLCWFIRRFRPLKDELDSRACMFVVRELVNAAFEFNPSSGLKLAEWTLNNEYITFSDALSLVLRNLLDSVGNEEDFSPFFDVYRQLFLYVDDKSEGDADLLRKLVGIGKLVMRDRFMSEILPELQSSIRIQCSPQAAKCLMDTLDGCLSPRERPARKTAGTWDEAMKRFEETSYAGWDKHYDGGRRIDTIRRLVEIDPVGGRKFAFETLAKDVKNDWTSMSSMAYIEEILPLIADDIDADKVFAEEFDYMNRAMRQEPEFTEDMPDITPEDLDSVALLARFLVYLSKFPPVFINENSAYLLAVFINGGHIEILDELEDEMLFLNVCMFLKYMKSDKLVTVISRVTTLAGSMNYLKRLYAKEILRFLKIPVPPVMPRELPADYTTAYAKPSGLLSGVKKHRDINNIMPVNTDDPMVITSTFEFIRKCLAEQSALDEYNIASRAVMFMNANLEAWSYKKEIDLRNHLNAISLHCSYPRLVADAARNGIMEVATELIDAGIVKENDVSFVLQTYDHAVLTWPIVAKPDFVGEIMTSEFTGVPNDWESMISESPRLQTGLQLYNGMYVIAERTYSVCIVDRNPYEIYEQEISSLGADSEDEHFFGTSGFHFLSCLYAAMGYNDLNLICERENWFRQFSEKAKFIAMNPQFADKLGWHLSAEGLFAWDDSHGERMVESVYWRQGNTNYRNYMMSEASEGWIVIATARAMEQIRSYLGGICQRKRIIRGRCGSQDGIEPTRRSFVEEI